MTTQGEYRDWQPGDGLTCRFARQAPLEIPCGRPVRTAISVHTVAGRNPRTHVSPLCANHADFGMPPPLQVMTASKRAAQEALTVAHWEEYQALLKAAVDERMSAARRAAGLEESA